MKEHQTVDENDPVKRAYRRYRQALLNIGFVASAVLGFALLAGVPHLQTTYTYHPRFRGPTPTATQKTAAWYISITGWQHVKSGQYGQIGCPLILFIPLGDCIDLSGLPFAFLGEQSIP